MLFISLLLSFIPNHNTSKGLSRNTQMDREQFNGLFGDIFDEALSKIKDPQINDAVTWIKKVVDYNVPGGKQNRGLSIINAYQHLVGRNLNDIEVKNSYILGWCVELLQAFFLVADDIMDHSKYRRQKTCWYLLDKVGHIAINDSFLLESLIYVILKLHFKPHSQYLDIIELFHQVTYITEIGQAMDLITSAICENIDEYSFNRYYTIIEYKTAYYSFYLPIALAMYLNGIIDEELHRYALKILIEIGKFFQIQDDFLDCYGNSEITGKIGTDIEEGKCSWLIVNALQIASNDQKEILKFHYGKNDSASLKIIKNLYDELDLKTAFYNYEETSYIHILYLINQCTVLPKEMFIDLLEKIYKRSV